MYVLVFCLIYTKHGLCSLCISVFFPCEFLVLSFIGTMSYASCGEKLHLNYTVCHFPFAQLNLVRGTWALSMGLPAPQDGSAPLHLPLSVSATVPIAATVLVQAHTHVQQHSMHLHTRVIACIHACTCSTKESSPNPQNSEFESPK